MKISVNWLKEFVDFDLSVVELASALTSLGLEVEGVEYLGQNLEKVVIGQLLKIEPHPNADKLVYCKVDVGTEQLDIVCGAKNIQVNDKVPVALVGAELPNGMKIKRSAIRGLESHGMLCSAKELQLAEDHSGIYILPAAAAIGTRLGAYLHLEDTVLEISLTPNRADCLSVLGIAREVAAYCDKPLKMPAVSFAENGPDVRQLASVTIAEPTLCLRYAARVIQNVEIKDSPPWLQARLRAVGLRPINNVVDVTNYVLMELGHPLHAFDYDRLAGHKVNVRLAKSGEKFTTLDGVERTLATDNLLICDADKPIALAGVMGGANSEVTVATKNLLLESAYFKPQNVHHTSKLLALETEATYRFTRGADIEGLVLALERTAQLIQSLAGGEIASGRLDAYPQPQNPLKITLRPTRVNAILGTAIAPEAMRALLERLKFRVETTTAGFVVSVPFYRADVTREIDLIEEIARLHDYQNIPADLISGKIALAENERFYQLRRIKDVALHYGLDEIVTYSFIDPKTLTQLQLPAEHRLCQVVPVANPLTEKQSIMRPSLLPGILTTLCYNEFQQNKNGKIFELGKVFWRDATERLPAEALYLAGAIGGSRETDALYRAPGKVDFYDLKALIEGLMESLELPPPRFVAEADEVYYHPGVYAAIELADEVVGHLGALHPGVKAAFEVTEDVFIFELDLDKVLSRKPRLRKYQPFSRFPAVNLDLALVVAEGKTVREITEIIWQRGGKVLNKVELFDVYRGKPIPAGHKSLAFALSFRSDSGTLTDAQVQERYQKIVGELNKHGAEVRA